MLSGLDPLPAEPEAYEFAITMPQGARVQKDGATFTVEASYTKTGETFSSNYILQERIGSDGRFLFRINPADLNDMRAQQAKARAWEEADPDASSGSINIIVIPCRFDEGPSLDDSFSVSLRTSKNGAFLPLIRDLELRTVARELAKDGQDATLEDLPVCEH